MPPRTHSGRRRLPTRGKALMQLIERLILSSKPLGIDEARRITGRSVRTCYRLLDELLISGMVEGTAVAGVVFVAKLRRRFKS
jgi:predicted transcriptional regulator